MKNFLMPTLIVALLMVACNQKSKEQDSISSPMMHSDSTMMHSDSTMTHGDHEMMNEHSKLYSCPMHPEVQGKLNDKCSECGMKLDVEVK